MNKNEYFSNSYRTIISNYFLHLILSLIEYIFTLSVQVIIFITEFDSEDKYNYISFHFHLIIKNIPMTLKLIIIILIYIIIMIYFFIYNRYHFQCKNIVNTIIINLFEIFLFRVLFIFICHTAFSIKGISLCISIIISIPIFAKIINNFIMNHLYYYCPHFVSYPFDYYSSFTDIIHLFEKIFISLSLYSTIITFKKFLFVVVFLLQISSVLFSIYIFIFKSYCIMSNIFLNKTRFSFQSSTLLINLLMIFLGNNNLKGSSFFIMMINIYHI